MNEETIRALQLCRVCQRVSEGKQLRRRRRRLTMFETMSVPSISTSVCFFLCVLAFCGKSLSGV